MFFDPFEEYVIVAEETRQKWVFSSRYFFFCRRHLDAFSLFGYLVPRYASRRQELLAGVNPADLSVYGVALTQDLSPRGRVTNAEIEVRFPPADHTN